MAYTSLLDRLGLHRRELRAWALYDVANSAFMTTVLTWSSRSSSSACRPGLAAEVARSRFAFATSIVGGARRPAGPLPGRDRRLPRAARRRSSGAFLALGAAATAALYLASRGPLGLRPRDLRGRNVAVTSTLAFYNALLPAIASESEVDRVSTAGFALGYLGGGVLFAVNLWHDLGARPPSGSPTPAPRPGSPSLSVAVWWVLFSIPLFRHVPEPRGRGLEPASAPGRALSASPCGDWAGAFRELRHHRTPASSCSRS